MTKRINRVYTIMLLTLLVLGQLTTPGYAVEDMWTVANTIIVNMTPCTVQAIRWKTGAARRGARTANSLP